MSKSPVDNRPQRYDRILIPKRGKFIPKTFKRCGVATESGCGSDHYGVCATFGIDEFEQSKIESSNRAFTEQSLRPIEVIENLTEISSLIASYLPSLEDQQRRKAALLLLKSTLAQSHVLEDIEIVTLGSYCMGTYFADSDIDVLVIGNVPPTTFFDVATSKFKDLDEEFRGVHIVNSLVTIVEVSVLDIKFDIQYCQAPELLIRYHAKDSPSMASLVFDPKLSSSLSPSSLRPLNTYRDTIYLLNTIPDAPSYRTAYRLLALYLKKHGLYSAKFGHLGGIHLSLMLNHVMKLMSPSNSFKFSEATIVHTFFNYFATFDFGTQGISDPTLPSHVTVCQSRTPRDAIFIPSIHTPTARKNVASSCTRLTALTLNKEFAHMANMLRTKSRPLESRILSREESFENFQKEWGTFVTIKVDIWDVGHVGGDKVREMVGVVESRIPRLMVSLGRIEGLEGRAWIGRLRDQAKDEEIQRTDEEDELSGWYLIGIGTSQDSKEMDEQMRKVFAGKVITAVREFEREMRGLKEFNDGNVWINMEVVSRLKMQGRRMLGRFDDRDWGTKRKDRTVEMVEEEVDDEISDTESGREKSLPIKKHQKSKSKSLRPAQDVISRINWDPKLSAEDFLIGYEDRFLGVKEIELEKWKSDATDEEFIPMHRIVWIRRKGEDGQKIWDRKRKVELIFGSGVVGGLG